MIFQHANESVFAAIYYCPICEGYFQEQAGMMTIRCAVMHSPGSCCHYMEKSVSKEQLAAIREVMKDVEGGKCENG